MALVVNEEQQMLKESARGFLAEHAPISEVRAQRDSGSELGYSPALWGKMVDMGWAAILVPEQFGGLAFGHVGMGQIIEETGRTLTASPLISTAILGVTLINLAGSDSQKSELLGKIANGDLTLALAIDEGTQHSPANTKMSASKQDGEYVLNGTKRYVIDGSSADNLIVVTRTSGNPGDLKGISLFNVNTDTNGINIERTNMIDGHNSSIITFADVHVDENSLLGEFDRGFRPLSTALDVANVHLACELLGIAQESFDITLKYMKERKQFGALIGSFQALQHRAASWWSEIELCKSIVLKALQSLDEGDAKSPALASIAKAKLCEIVELSTNEAIQLHGGIGMTDEYDIGFFIKRARPAQMLYGGYSYHADRYALISGY